MQASIQRALSYWLGGMVIFGLLTVVSAGIGFSQEIEMIQIGVLAPWTGAMANIGQQQKNGIEIAIDEINDNGGLLGKQMVMQLEDDKGDPEMAAEMVQKLVDNGANVIIGSLSNSTTSAAASVANKIGLPLIAPLATDPTTLTGEWIFGSSYTDPFLGEMQARYMVQKLACQRPAQLVNSSTDRMKVVSDAIAATLEQLNVPLVAVESYAHGDQDFKTQLNNIKTQTPDCLSAPTYSVEVELIRSQMKEVGLDIPLVSGLGNDTLEVEATSSLSGPAPDGILLLAHYAPASPHPTTQAFQARYEKIYGREPSAAAALAYDAIMLYRAAVEKAGTTDHTAVRDALANLKELKTLATTPLFSMDNYGSGMKATNILELGEDKEWHYRDTMELPVVATVTCEDVPRAAGALRGRLTFAGSTSVQPLAARLGEAFRALNPDVTLDIAAGGTSVGIQAIHDGIVDIGMASRDLKSEETQGVCVFKIAIDVIAVVVNDANPVQGLTLDQLQGIYTGQITNWKEVGGLDQSIVVGVREKTSGTRGAFDHIVLDEKEPTPSDLHVVVTAGDMAALVGENPAAIGYVGFGNIEVGLHILSINGISPSIETVQQGIYPLVRPLQFMTSALSQPIAANFIDFVLGPEGQQVVVDSGWVPATAAK